MKLLVLGATGATGQQVVGQALQAGHEVTAYVRNPSKLAREPGLRVVGAGGEAGALRGAIFAGESAS
jgi:uncharacterized protein YbjT (DUF2867 family)